MNTKEWLLSRTTLPVTGIYTLKEHFTSVLATITANIGGEIVITPLIYQIQTETKTIPVEINTKKIEINIDISPKEITLADVQKIEVVINPCG